jgi:homoserine dehydrogenase
MGPTASAVMGDVMDIARGIRMPTFGMPATQLAVPVAAAVTSASAWYLRMMLVDKPGALAKVATALGDAGISIHRMRQYDHTDAQAPVLIVTHKATRDDVNDALARMSKTGVVLGDPVALRIEEV